MDRALCSAEEISVCLRNLYEQFGYTAYKMSKFEEYDLYARNKDFLVSDSVITFTDRDGKLMALKPDVTLSIVKNGKDLPWVQKVYYNENVYRVTRGAHGYREIMQIGLEAMGSIDDYCICEVLTLAAQSLKQISPDAVLEVSDLSILKELTDSLQIPLSKRETLVRFISQKNAHELASLCRDCGLSGEQTDVLRWLASTCGTPSEVLPELETKLSGFVSQETLRRFANVLQALDNEEILRIDFSVVDDIHYYNGFVFKGFVRGIPESILSGGQYDKLMKKMHRTSGAIGFAVYTDLLSRLDAPNTGFDVDTVLLYSPEVSPKALREQVNILMATGISVMTQTVMPENIRCRQVLKFNGSEVETLENNA